MVMVNEKKIRTMVLDEAVVKKLRQKSRGNMSKLANEILKAQSKLS